MWRWTPGRLLVQLFLLLVLVVMCFGLLGRDGVVGLIAVVGLLVVGYGIIRALR